MADSGSCTAGTRVVISRNTRISRKGDQARKASPAVRSLCCPEPIASYSFGTGASFLPRVMRIMTPMQTTAPMTSGSCGPINWAVRNMGTTKETDAASVIPNTPFRAFGPPPKIITIRKGETRNRRHSMTEMFWARVRGSIPVTVPSVRVGTPTEPKAVGMALTTRHATMVRMGSKPRATRIPAGMATAVPKPAMPSMKWPKAQPIRSIWMRPSRDMPASICLMSSIAPVSRVSW